MLAHMVLVTIIYIYTFCCTGFTFTVKITVKFIAYWKVTIYLFFIEVIKKGDILVIGLIALILSILYAKIPLFWLYLYY